MQISVVKASSYTTSVIKIGEHPLVTHLIAETEIAPTTGQHHIQGYLRLSKDSREQKVKDILPTGAHIEKAKRSLQANYQYCTKDGTSFVSKGFSKDDEEKNAKKEKRSREILEAIEQLNEATFALKFPSFYLYHYDKYKTHKLNFQTKTLQQYNGGLKDKNFWVYGKPGTGKSRWAHSLTEQVHTYSHNVSKWWSAYSSEHEVVIFEDWPNDMQKLIQHLKIWSDRYPFIGEIKNSALGISPNDYCLVITSNYSIDQAFTDEPNANHTEDRAALHRRFTEIDFDDLQLFGGELDPPKYLEQLKENRNYREGNTAGDPNVLSDSPLVPPPEEPAPPPPAPKHSKKNEYTSPGYYDILRQQRKTEAIIKRLTFSINYQFHQLNKRQGRQDSWESSTPSESGIDVFDAAFNEEEE